MAASRRHHRSPTTAYKTAGQDSWAFMRPGLTTVPLQSPMNASPFWIMFLLSSGVDESRMVGCALGMPLGQACASAEHTPASEVRHEFVRQLALQKGF
jgi:hypothetical protein